MENGGAFVRTIVSLFGVLLLMTLASARDSLEAGLHSCANLLPSGYEYRFEVGVTIDTRNRGAEFREPTYGIKAELEEQSSRAEEVQASIGPFFDCVNGLIDTKQLLGVDRTPRENPVLPAA
jgi:hypothetical protein